MMMCVEDWSLNRLRELDLVINDSLYNGDQLLSD